MHQWDSELLFELRQKLSHPPFVDEVFEPRFFAIRAITVLVEDANDRRTNGHAVARSDDDAGVLCELLMPRNARELHAKIDAGLDALTRTDAHGDEADVVRRRN